MENPTLKEEVEPTTPIKEWLVNYVGNVKAPKDGNVTVEMIVETLAREFPEFVLAVAEENWIRGYRQGLEDVDAGLNWASASGNNGIPTGILVSETDETKA